jgi:hypothetical protein
MGQRETERDSDTLCKSDIVDVIVTAEAGSLVSHTEEGTKTEGVRE